MFAAQAQPVPTFFIITLTYYMWIVRIFLYIPWILIKLDLMHSFSFSLEWSDSSVREHVFSETLCNWKSFLAYLTSIHKSLYDDYAFNKFVIKIDFIPPLSNTNISTTWICLVLYAVLCGSLDSVPMPKTCHKIHIYTL